MSFKLAINAAGAISAGAYTAGVLDFLFEALDEWSAAKAKWKADPENAPVVPMHEVSIEAFSGASAGGMCAAIACIQTQQKFSHIHDSSPRNTDNRLYESWVNIIDIRRLLEIRDLKAAPPLLSLLDSTIIEDIARFALSPAPMETRDYISDSLRLFVTLTNLRGIPYSLDAVAKGSPKQSTCYYGDRLQFGRVPDAAVKPLPANNDPDEAWELLREAAMATGAFPVFLAPRIIRRKTSDYVPPLFAVPPPPPPEPLRPDFSPPDLAAWETLNVDGGVIDNDPFNLAHDYLAGLQPSTNGVNPRSAWEADRAVLTIAPFPAQAGFNPQYRPEAEASVFSAAGSLATALISQSQFFGESLAVMMGGETFSRFVIAPVDRTAPDKAGPLQCGTLGAFGGFFERGYRAHDFALGRRNCQQFLREHFVLPTGNAVIRAGLERAAGHKARALAAYSHPAPTPDLASRGHDWLPIIPLCGSAAERIRKPLPASMSDNDLDEVVNLVVRRFKAVLPLLSRQMDSCRVRLLLRAAGWLLATVAKGKFKAYLRSQLP